MIINYLASYVSQLLTFDKNFKGKFLGTAKTLKFSKNRALKICNYMVLAVHACKKIITILVTVAVMFSQTTYSVN